MQGAAHQRQDGFRSWCLFIPFLWPKQKPGWIACWMGDTCDTFFSSECGKKRARTRGLTPNLVEFYVNLSWLVVWNMNFIFPNSWEVGMMIQSDFHSIIFQRGRAQPPTSHLFVSLSLSWLPTNWMDSGKSLSRPGKQNTKSYWTWQFIVDLPS